MSVANSSTLALSSSIVCHDSISWSELNEVAVATEKGVVVFFFKFDLTKTDDKISYQRCNIPQNEDLPDFDVGIDRKWILKGRNDPPCETSSKLVLDKTLNEKKESSLDLRTYSKAVWSPKGFDQNGRCLLASVSLDHRISIWMVKKNSKVQKIGDLSELVYKHFKESWGKINRTQEALFTEFRSRKFATAAIGLTWSDIFILSESNGGQQPKRQKLSDCSENSKTKCALLVSRMRSGQLVFFRFTIPLKTLDDVSIETVVDTEYGRPTAAAFCNKCRQDRSSSSEEDILAVGNLDGFISLWLVRYTKSGFEVTKVTDVWIERDQLSVDALVWIQNQTDRSRYVLVAGKGYFTIAFNIRWYSGTVTVENQIIKKSMFYSSTTGICARGSVAFSTSQDGCFQKMVISQGESGLNMDITAIVKSNPVLRSLKGCAFSPSGAFVAYGVVSPVGSFSQKNSLCVHQVIPEDEVTVRVASHEGPLTEISDSLDLIRRQYLNRKGFDFPKELQTFIKDDFITQEKIERKLHLAFYLERLKLKKVTFVATRKKILESMKAEITKLEKKFELTKNVVILRHITDVLEDLGLPVSSELSCRLMCKWLKKYQEALPNSLKSVAQDLLQRCGAGYEQDSHEKCCLCGESIPFTNESNGSCTNGHMWRRCSLTFQLCQEPTCRKCALCGEISRVVHEDTDSLWLQQLSRKLCIFCGGHFVD